MNPQIFKSESYQKILKHVIKFRYPELSFERGLMKQLTEPSCLVIHKKDNVVYRQCELMALLTMHDQKRYKNIDDIDREAQILSFIYGSYIIVGRAITICELHDVLNSKLRTYSITLQHKAYYVHEQSQEIIDKIANLFD